jgi:hypothetical protein
MLITDLEDDAIREIANHIHISTDFVNFRASSKVIADATQFTATIDKREYKYRYYIWNTHNEQFNDEFISIISDMPPTRWFNFRHGTCKMTLRYEFDDNIVDYTVFQTYHLGKVKLVKNNDDVVIFEQKSKYALIYDTWSGYLIKIFVDYSALRITLPYNIRYPENTINIASHDILPSVSRYTKIRTKYPDEILHRIYCDGTTIYRKYNSSGQKTVEYIDNGEYMCAYREYIEGKLYYELKKTKLSQEKTIYNTKTGQILAHILIYKGAIVKLYNSKRFPRYA